MAYFGPAGRRDPDEAREWDLDRAHDPEWRPPVEGDGRMVVVGLELPEVQRCRCCGDTQRADGRTLCQACLDHNCNAGGLCYLPLGTVVS